jgi:hypothetical protein
MTETYYAGSYWLARQESAEACSRRAEVLFKLLANCDPEWAHWYEAANSFEEARTLHLATDAATLLKVFRRKRNRIGDGVRLWVWTGSDPERTTGFDAVWGDSSHHLNNYCVLTPPEQGLVAERVLMSTVMSQVLRAMVLAWEPEWGVVTSEAHRDMVSEHADVGTFVGWVMYFARQRGTVPPLPAPVRVEPVEDKGTLVLLTPERFTVSNPEHVALAARVHQVLQEAGLLRPLQPQGPAGAT